MYNEIASCALALSRRGTPQDSELPVFNFKSILKPFSSAKSLVVALALSFSVSLLIWLAWLDGLLAPVQAAFLVTSLKRDSELMSPQAWLAALLIIASGMMAGFAVERAGARRSFPFVGLALIALCGLSLLASGVVSIDIAFAPQALAIAGAGLTVQVWRLWNIDVLLTRHVARLAAGFNRLEGSAANERLMSGLKLLETVLPLSEAVVFRPDEDGRLVPVARLRKSSSGTLETKRNSAWREAVKLCDKAVAHGEMMKQDKGRAETEWRESVAMPLTHEGRIVGVLLLRLHEEFDEGDSQLLKATGAQLARNLQRDGARKATLEKNFPAFISARAADSRFESFGVVSGLLTEHRFGAHVLNETSDGHAVAYLDGTLAYLNSQMLTAAALTEEEARQLDLFGLLDHFRTGVFDEPAIAVRRVIQTGATYERELNFAERDQSIVLRITLINERAEDETPPQPLCLAITARDVTRMKEYEKLKSDMISLMSHELRTPITSINGFAELLAVDEKIPAESREFLSIISSESQRLSRMINAFLAVTQLEAADKQEVSMIPLRLDEVVRETVTKFQPAAKRKRIRLVEEAATKIPPVAADKSLITQSVANLIDNAIRYSPERTTITVTTTLEAESVRVTVEDRGYGIPPESVDKVWEKFYRIARDGQEKDEESTGLGLSFVREAVEQHGGTVSLESEAARGSKFSFTLPRL